MSSRVTKTEMIRRALENGDRLTHLKGLAYGTYRLADVIYRLKKQGMRIITDYKLDCNGTEYAEYRLADAWS